MIGTMPDYFDPNNWSLFNAGHEFRIYGDDKAETWCIVDEEDYHFLVQWKWSWTTPNSSNAKRKRSTSKIYLRRVVETQIETPYPRSGTYTNPETGRETRLRKERIQQTLRLHTVIMLRTSIAPPSPDHLIPDHIDGNERDCRRQNLRWATPAMNAANLFGKSAR